MNARLRDPAETKQFFVSQESYWLPDLVLESAWLEHAPFAFWLTGALRPRSMIELGVHRGFSYFAFCQAVQRLALDTRCSAVDHWAGDEHAGFYGEDVYREVVKTNRRYYGFSRLIRADFADACAQFADGSIDLLHIDGCHTYEAVRRDFEMWQPKLSERGVVLFHDTAEYHAGFGVYLLWEVLRDRYPHFEFTHGHGLGILGVGEKIPAHVRGLFAASTRATESQAIRVAYERLGGFVGSLQQREEMDKLTQHVRHLEALIASYEGSTSWRLTAPLRRIARLVKPIREIAPAPIPLHSSRPLRPAPNRRTRNTA